MDNDKNSNQELFLIQGVYKDYEWGKDISSSSLSKFTLSSPSIPKSNRAAELWFGIHKSGCSMIYDNNSWLPLDKFIKGNPNNFNSLAKILTINKPLSIQLHPNAIQAKQLNLSNPQTFPDSNPKPEMAIALEKTKLLCGLKKIEDLNNFLLHHPLAKHYLPKDSAEILDKNGVREFLKLVFNLNISFDKETCGSLISKAQDFDNYNEIAKKVLDSFDHIDIGIIALYFLDHHVISKGQAIFIKTNIPHAYLEGDVFECMMNSDNVIRGGLTSKPIDKQNFIELLDLNPYNPLAKGKQNSEYITTYDIRELPFVLEVVKIDSENEIDLTTSPLDGHQLVIIAEGEATLSLNKKEISTVSGSSYYHNSKNPFLIKSKKLFLFRLINRK